MFNHSQAQKQNLGKQNEDLNIWIFKRKAFFLRLDKRTEDLSEAISSVAKDVTRVVVEIQDTKRQALLKHTRDALSAEVQIRKKWRQLIERLIHERYSIAYVVT